MLNGRSTLLTRATSWKSYISTAMTADVEMSA